ncbi:ATP-binding cassette, subfamily C [[Eubacterium] yurii]|nr:ATP-binding cassette, subfamily C [[Eubacterium] yurii]
MIKKRLIKEAPEGMKHIKKIVFFNWIGLLCNVVAIFSVAMILQAIVEKNGFANIALYSSLIIISTAIRYFFRMKIAKESFAASGKIKYKLRDKLYGKIVRLGANYGEKVSISSVVQLFSEGIEQMEIYFSRYLPQFFYSLLAPLTLFAIICTFSIKTALVLMLCVPLIPLSIVAVQKFAKKLFSKYWGKYTKLGDDFYENLQGLTTLKIYNADERQQEKMNENAENFRKITMKVLVMQLNSVSLMDLIAYMGAALGVIFSLMELTAGKINVGQAFFIMMISSEFFIPLRILGSFFHIAMNGMSASDRLFAILDLEEDDKEKVNIEKFSDIEIKNLSFSYNSERKILKNINTTIKQGSFVGIVGESGCGKSTLASLITTQYKNYEGDITVKGNQIRDISPTCLWNNVCLVKNENYIFKGTVRGNLQIAKKNCSDQDMIDKLKEVNLWDFLESKDGLDTALAENASNLSGGQKQRLAIARALLKDADLYIFDEATSNIDVESEEIILSVINSLRGKKTILFISHRLANVEDADNILVFEEGCLVEQGKKDELIKNKKTFYNLYNKQAELEDFFKDEDDKGEDLKNNIEESKKINTDDSQSVYVVYDNLENMNKAVATEVRGNE